jgi:uncharacterized protein YifN (PemK superfamily)
LVVVVAGLAVGIIVVVVPLTTFRDAAHRRVVRKTRHMD